MSRQPLALCTHCPYTDHSLKDKADEVGMLHTDRMFSALEGLNEYEREVVVREAEAIAEALRRGVPTYGHWDPLTDQRDHLREAEEEDRDRRVYAMMGRIKNDMSSRNVNEAQERDTLPSPPTHPSSV